jgi:Zinc-finger of C2H2 type
MLVCPASRCPLPTWDRTFSSAEALLEHARQTRTQHPLCTTCLRVFKDTAALDQVRDFVFHAHGLNQNPGLLLQHVEAKHVVVCQPCNRKYKSQSALDQHWRASSAHPNCPVCDAGVADTNALAVVRADLTLSVILRISSRDKTSPARGCSTSPIPILKCAVAVRSWTRAT